MPEHVIHKARRGSYAPLSIPKNARLLHVGEQGGDIAAWYTKPADQEGEEYRTLHIEGTGCVIAESLIPSHVATVMMRNGIVWHVFDPEGASNV